MSRRRNLLEYKIPGRVVRKDTIFEGVGLKEIGIIFIAGLTGLLLQTIFNQFIFNLWTPIATSLVFGLVAFVLIRPMLKYNENIITVWKRRTKYRKQQNKFYYIRGKGR